MRVLEEMAMIEMAAIRWLRYFMWHLMFMKDISGPAVGAQVDLGSTVYIHGKFTMFSGSFNASIPSAPAQVLHLKGSPDAWAGQGGTYTDTNNPGGFFPIMIDGSGLQNCFSGDLTGASKPNIISPSTS